jgi:hypothetical protein
MAVLVPLAQLTTAFPPITQVHPVCCPGLSRLHLLCSPSGSKKVFLSFAKQRQRCCYLKFLACMDGQQWGFVF